MSENELGRTVQEYRMDSLFILVLQEDYPLRQGPFSYEYNFFDMAVTSNRYTGTGYRHTVTGNGHRPLATPAFPLVAVARKTLVIRRHMCWSSLLKF